MMSRDGMKKLETGDLDTAETHTGGHCRDGGEVTPAGDCCRGGLTGG